MGEQREAAGTGRRGRPTAETSRLKLAHLLEVARDQFAAHGFRAVTMRKVADIAQVSTRTLYDHYSDKLSLFRACLDSGSVDFPPITHDPEVEVAVALRVYAASLVRMLSSDASLRISMVVSREGGEFPELVRSADAVQHKYLMVPLAAFMRDAGLARDDGESRAKLFVALALAEWQRRYVFLHPFPQGQEIEDHAEQAVDLFLKGAIQTVGETDE
jgi:AcrR family transcriptional regulator